MRTGGERQNVRLEKEADKKSALRRYGLGFSLGTDKMGFGTYGLLLAIIERYFECPRT
jgi:hypothetical protein